MTRDSGTGADEARSGAGGFRPHKFGRDPFERLRLALRGRSVGRLAAVGAAALVSAVVIGGAVFGAGQGGRDVETAVGAHEKRLAELEADVSRRERQIADLERRRAAAEAEIADSGKRIASLEGRRADLQRQVAELTAPVEQPGTETADASPDAADAPAEGTETAVDEATPSTTATEPDAVLSASSRRSGNGEDAPSSAEVEPAVATTSAAAEPGHAGGPFKVFIHVRSSDRAARERARVVAAELERRGVTVAEIRGVLRPVRRDAVRFFYDADREAVTELQDAVRLASPPSGVAPQPQDFRGYRAPPRQGTLELWLS